jgi:hypothetical protein
MVQLEAVQWWVLVGHPVVAECGQSRDHATVGAIDAWDLARGQDKGGRPELTPPLLPPSVAVLCGSTRDVLMRTYRLWEAGRRNRRGSESRARLRCISVD